MRFVSLILSGCLAPGQAYVWPKGSADTGSTESDTDTDTDSDSDTDTDSDADTDTDATGHTGDSGTAIIDQDGDGFAAGVDCDDLHASVNPGAAENSATVWDDNCDGAAHNDGTTYLGHIEDPVDQISNPVNITFTGSNWIADIAADATFENATLGVAGSSGVVTWEVMEDVSGGLSTADFVVEEGPWSSATLDGTFPGLAMLSGASVLDPCIGIEFTGLVIGSRYAFAAAFGNVDTTAVNVFLLTGTSYTVSGGAREMTTEVIDPGSDEVVVGGFVAVSPVEQIYVCAGLADPDTLFMSHAWFGDASW